MREDVLDIDNLPAIVNERDQTILVSAYVEHRQVTYEIRRPDGRLQLAGVAPHGSFNRIRPVFQPVNGLREPLAEIPNPPLADYPQILRFPYWELTVKCGG